MGIIASELTLVELCGELKVTPSWVNKAIRDFNLPREGRGRLRKFTRNEFIVLRNAKIFLQLGYSLTFLQDLQKEEALLRKHITDVIEKTEKDFKNGKTKLGGPGEIFSFLLSFPIVTEWTSYIEIGKDAKEVRIDVFDLIEDNLGGFFPARSYKKDISNKIDRTSLELQEFKEHLDYVYRSNPME